jgi:hypothetical protein
MATKEHKEHMDKSGNRCADVDGGSASTAVAAADFTMKGMKAMKGCTC